MLISQPKIASLIDLFADWSGPVWYLQKNGNAWEREKAKLEGLAPFSKITGFGEDAEGELYVITNADTGSGNKKGLYKVVECECRGTIHWLGLS
jgi:hypothetical protein